MDPFGHPDLERLGRTLRSRLDETLDAEQAAARMAALRRRTLRDRLIEADDRAEDIVLATVDGHMVRGRICAVGVDHVAIEEAGRQIYVAIGHIVTLEAR